MNNHILMIISFTHTGVSNNNPGGNNGNNNSNGKFIMSVNVTNPTQPQSIGYQTGTITSVDWGDGTVNTDTTHTYSSVGDYDISIEADGLHLKVGSIATDIKQWGDVTWSSMEEMFKFSSISTWTATDAPALVGVTNMRSMFAFASSFNQPLNDRDTSSVTGMFYVFGGANLFDQPLNNRDTSSVANMSSMFDGANSFNQPLNDRDTSSVITMNGMFSNARSFNQPLNNRDTSSVANMGFMFSNATSFNQDISSWCVTNISIKPDLFDSNSGFLNQSALQPQRGTCP